MQTLREVRTLGFYQPFCSLMLHGKKETRWVREGKKPPFPLGEYLFYSTKNPCANQTLFQWCGPEIMLSISETLSGDITRFMNGIALAVGELVNLRLMTKEDEAAAFVKFVGKRTVKDKDGNDVVQVQWILEFQNITTINPFKFKEGKQGVGKFMLHSEPAPKLNV